MIYRDEVEKALKLLLDDGRRKPNDAEGVVNLWLQEFRDLPQGKLYHLVRTWIRENPTGRPSVAELYSVLREGQPKGSQDSQEARWERERRAEVAWAVSVLESPGSYGEPAYEHTLDYARRCLREHKFTSWEAARAWLGGGPALEAAEAPERQERLSVKEIKWP